MQCGIDPRQSSVSSCSFTCHRSSSTLSGNLSTPDLVGPSQVWFGLRRKFQHKLTQYPYVFSPSTSDGRSSSQLQILHLLDHSTPGDIQNNSPIFSRVCTLAVIPTLTQTVEMYKLTKRWHTNWSMKLLVKEGAAYFIVYVSLVPALSIVRPRNLSRLPP